MSANCGASTVYCTVSTIPSTCATTGCEQRVSMNIGGNSTDVCTRTAGAAQQTSVLLKKLNKHGDLPVRDRDVDGDDELQLRRLHSLLQSRGRGTTQDPKVLPSRRKA